MLVHTDLMDMDFDKTIENLIENVAVNTYANK